jgi:hypothetical protein
MRFIIHAVGIFLETPVIILMLGDPSIVHYIMLFFTHLNAKENSSITVNISMVLFAKGCSNVIAIHNTMICDVNMHT